MSEQQNVTTTPAPVRAEDAILLIGSRIREIRTSKSMTLQALAAATGMSLSMLSLVERGKTAPSIGTLVAICSALDVQMADLLAPAHRVAVDPVSWKASQVSYQTAEGVLRRVLIDDRMHAVEIAINEYLPQTGSAPAPMYHHGYEYGVILEGTLTVELDGQQHQLKEGDLISYSSTRNHRIWNYGRAKARALWINLHRP